VSCALPRSRLPLDYIVQDWQYWGGDGEWDGTWSGMIWNPERFPRSRRAHATLHDELHVKLMNSIWPSVGNDTALARELDAKGLRFEPLHWISKKARIYDAFSPEGTRDLLQTHQERPARRRRRRPLDGRHRGRGRRRLPRPDRGRSATSRISGATRSAISRVTSIRTVS
jgi:hypothetical protein